MMYPSGGQFLAGLSAVRLLATLRAYFVFSITGKPLYNESEGTNKFFLRSRNFVIAWAFYYRINYREIKFFIAGISL
jgi:hypothetical protein